MTEAPRRVLLVCVHNSARSRMAAGLPDPFPADGDGSSQIEAFRRARDEIRKRLEETFG